VQSNIIIFSFKSSKFILNKIPNLLQVGSYFYLAKPKCSNCGNGYVLLGFGLKTLVIKLLPWVVCLFEDNIKAFIVSL
jgi:hypothetical protein